MSSRKRRSVRGKRRCVRGRNETCVLQILGEDRVQLCGFCDCVGRGSRHAVTTVRELAGNAPHEEEGGGCQDLRCLEEAPQGAHREEASRGGAPLASRRQ